ncbi:MAG: cyclic nucleotide-binding domain-containing protein [Dehalococcoidales bacterium]|nr:cyclic nucleotide-binding domain-containing protein [Dehalococcoidales bacterium]
MSYRTGDRSDKSVISGLKSCPVLATLGDNALKEIASFTAEKQFEAGTILFEEADSSEEFFIVQEGRVAIQASLPKSVTRASRRITVDIATSNEIVGWSAVVEPYTHLLTAVCLQDVRVLSINGRKLRQLIEKNHDIGYTVLKGVVRVAASRLDDTRQLLISERLLSVKPS